MSEKIKVLLVEPNKYPKMIEIDDTLEAMQKVVGGGIEEYMPFDDDAAIICNDEQVQWYASNRAIYSDDKKCKILFSVSSLYVSTVEAKILSLPEDLAKKYEEKFKI